MIQVLDQKTINQIAAGEVIERPMAVVKELIENALDAGATAITVEIKEGGISFIRLTDNGSGIAKEEIRTAFLRHATSKIKTMEDLLTVNSLGFRGEALSSIAAVAQVELITKQQNEFVGTRYEIHGGKEISFEEVGCPEGTTFLVRNLFYNTPARRKFLKSKTTEGNYIQELVQRYSLAHSDIRFSLIVDGKNKLQTSGDGKVKTNIYYHFGAEVTKNIVPITREAFGMKLTGFIGKPVLSRGNRMQMNYFVNGRYIKSPVITGAIEQAYKEFLMSHRYPFVTLLLTIDSNNLDVNVHPTKMEVRFTNQQEVYNIFYDTIYMALKESNLVPDVILEEKKPEKPLFVMEKHLEPFENKRQEEKENKKKQDTTVLPLPEEKTAPFSHTGQASFVKETFQQMDLKQEPEILPETPQFRIIGQVFDTYWLVEYENELLMIDQHAAHEKVLYEKLMLQLREKEGLTQELAAPIVVSLSGREIEVLLEHQKTFEKLGFRFESFGDKDYLITGVPADFLNLASKELFLELLDSLLQENRAPKPEMVLEHCATMACKAAVKGKHLLSFAEAKHLIEQMLQMEQPYHCPHGRPTTISMSKYELEKKFKRIV